MPAEPITTLHAGAQPMDPILAKSMDQNFAVRHERLAQTAERFNDGAAFIAQESKQHFLHASSMVRAHAVNALEKDGLADSILQSKTAGIFPNNLPANG